MKTPASIAAPATSKTQPIQKTFAQVLSNVCDTPNSQLPKPTLKGDKFSILILDDEYDLWLDDCKNNLHACIIWPKGTTPITVVALREKLKPLWKDLSPWGVTSIGKGFYEFVFSSIEDARRVRSVTSWFLNPGYLKLFPWTKDFSPSLQSNTSVQVWVRIHGLAQEYWRKRIIFAIASSAGTPICVDSVTSKAAIERTFGHFSRVLVDIDLSKDLKHEVLVERKGFAFFVGLEYENVPEFCGFCKLVGHNASVRRKVKKMEITLKGKAPVISEEGALPEKHNRNQPLAELAQKKKWIPKEVNVVDLETDEGNIFATLEVEDNVDNLQLVKVADINTEIQDKSHTLQSTLGSRDNRGMATEGNGTTQTTLVYESEMEDDSSEASEFVDATQRLESDNQNISQPTPQRIQQDMQFLKESWAVLADAYEEQIRLQQEALNKSFDAEADLELQIEKEVQSNIANSGFQLVTRKNRKKPYKSPGFKASTSHLTRAKVKPKPFK